MRRSGDEISALIRMHLSNQSRVSELLDPAIESNSAIGYRSGSIPPVRLNETAIRICTGISQLLEFKSNVVYRWPLAGGVSAGRIGLFFQPGGELGA